MLTGIVRHHRRLRADRLRRERGRRIHVLDLRRRHHRAARLLVRRGAVRAAARRRASSSRRSQAQSTEPQPWCVVRGFRTLLVGAMRVRWITIAVDGRHASSLRSWRCRYVPRQFFPASDRPELLVDLTLPQNASIYASERRWPARLDAVLKGDPDVEQLEHLCRPRRDPLLPAARRPAGQRLLRPGRRRRQGRRRARAAAAPSSSRCWPSSSRASIGRVVSAGARPAGRLAGAVPRQRARIVDEVRDDRASTSPRSSAAMPTRGGSISTGSSRPARSASGSTRTRRGCSA